MSKATRAAGAGAGFTLVEVMITVAIIATLCALTVVGLGKSQETASQNDTVETLVADLKSQQLLAMAGDSGSATAQQPEGVYMQANQYTLFAGSTFNGADANNFAAIADQAVSFSSTFPGSTVLFAKGSGEVVGFNGAANTITVHNASSNKTITINRLGAITVN